MSYSWDVRCMAPPSDDTDLCLWVNFNESRILFGCGEGMTRLFVQRRIGMKGLKGIFLPGGGVKSTGGLGGMIMSYADSGAKHLDVIGPSDTSQIVATLRGPVARDTMSLNVIDAPPDAGPDSVVPLYQSALFTVQALVLRSTPTPTPSDAEYDIEDPNFQPTRLTPAQLQAHSQLLVKWVTRNRNIEQRPTLPFGFQERSRSLPPAIASLETEMVYICQGAPMRGKFDVEKSSALGVPRGPLMGRLTNGESVEFEVNGEKRIVRPEDVLSPPSEGAVLLVVNCSRQNLENLLASKALAIYQNQDSSTKVQLAVHRVPAEVWADQRYQEWLRKFGPTTQHLIAPTTQYANDIAFRAFAWNALLLSALDEEIFHIPKSGTRPPPPIPDDLENVSVIEANHRMYMRNSKPLEHYKSTSPVDRDQAFPSTAEGLETALSEAKTKKPEYWQAAQEARAQVRQDPRWGATHAALGDDITVTTLGTGSALPSKHRNVSSTALDIPDFGYILLDCGEGTLGQMRRRFGSDHMEHFYRNLRLLYISHMHADHNQGLHYLLEDRMRFGIDTKLYIVAPDEVALALQELGAWQAAGSSVALANVVFIRQGFLESGADQKEWTGEVPEPEISDDFLAGKRQWPQTDIWNPSRQVVARAIHEMVRDLDLAWIQAVPMPHRGRAWGLVVQHKTGWKIAYSGDTMPCEAFVTAGQGATLCIHEATLEDDKPEIAADKRHSTMSQAIEIGHRMGAKHILLTHFSQRYPKLPKSRFIPSAHADNQAIVSISFDLMSVKLKDMWRMEYYMEALSLLFPPEEEAEDQFDEGEIESRTDGREAGAVTNGEGKKGKPSKKAKSKGGNPPDDQREESGSSKRSSTSSPGGKDGKKARNEDISVDSQS